MELIKGVVEDIRGNLLRDTHYPLDTKMTDKAWDNLPYRPSLDCPVCKGAGFIHPREAGQVVWEGIVPCRAPGCLKESTRGRVAGEAAKQTFESFQPVKGAEKALRCAKALAYGEAKFVWLLIYGRPGNGKTHLCNAIVREVRDRGLEVRMILAADLFSILREAMRDNMTDELLRRFKEIFFLAIDDYGVQYGSEWEQAKFDELMTSRFVTGRPTVLVTNKDFSELPERIQSRFTDKVMSQIAHNSAPDYRRLKYVH